MDISVSFNEGHSTLLIALDLFAVFDTIEHSTLLTRLEYEVSVIG